MDPLKNSNIEAVKEETGPNWAGFRFIPSVIVHFLRSVPKKKKNGQSHKPVIPLRFGKTGNPEIEQRYATHYVDKKRTSQLKLEKAQKQENQVEESSGEEETSTLLSQKLRPLEVENSQPR